MDPIFTPLDCLKDLTSKIHPVFSIGRSIAVALDYIANNNGNFDDLTIFIRDSIDELYKQNELAYAKKLENAYNSAMGGDKIFQNFLDDLGV